MSDSMNHQQLVDELNRAIDCVQRGDFATAITLYGRLLQYSFPDEYPSRVEILDRLAHAQNGAEYYNDALNTLKEIYDLRPDVLTLQNRMAVHFAMGEFKKAIEDTALIIKHPTATVEQQVQGHLRASHFFQVLANYNKAIFHAERALKLINDQHPNFYDAQKRLTFAHFAAGDYERAYYLYQYRYESFGEKTYHRLPHHDKTKICDTHHDLQGKTLLICMEQGFGDIIMMLRFIPAIQARGCKIIIEAYSELIPLLQGEPSLRDCQILFGGSQTPQFDYWCMIMSLPYLLGVGQGNLPPNPYLTAGAGGLVLAGHKCKIGLVWASGKLFQDSASKTMDLKYLKPFIEHYDADFYSLQYPKNDDIAQNGLAGKIIDLSPYIHNFYETAGFIKQCDIIICVDTAVAHLAGALGVPTLVLLPYDHTWRWHNRDDSVWYPHNFFLIRQQKKGDWASAVAQLPAYIAKFAITPKINDDRVLVDFYYYMAAMQLHNKPHNAFVYLSHLLAIDNNNIAGLKARIAISHAVREYETGIRDCLKLLTLQISPAERGEICLALSLLHQKIWTDGDNRFKAILALEQAEKYPHDQMTYNRHFMFGALRAYPFKDAFKIYQNRHSVHSTPSFVVKPYYDMTKIWQNQPVDTLLIVMEQGFGDMIQFCRFINDITPLCQNIFVDCYGELARLIEKNFPQVQIYRDGMYDAMVLMASLPNYVALDHYDWAVPYLTAPARELPNPLRDKMRIGLVWSSGVDNTDHKIKSMQLADLLPLLHQCPAYFYSIQTGPARDEIQQLGVQGMVWDITENITDFYDTAGYMMAMDLIITIDTASAHLAGALGVPCYVMIAKISDWRWGITDKPPLYGPQMTLIRQTEYDNWVGAVQTLIELVGGVIE